MKNILKISLVALIVLTCSALSAHRWHEPLYKCDATPGVLYEKLDVAQDACGNSEIVEVYRHHEHDRYYRVDDEGNYYYDDDRSVAGNAVEGAHDVASNVWHGIFG